MNLSSELTFGSVCSGIEAASCAWLPLGWRALWLSEIEPFPSAVLAQHHPETPNLGDMTKIAARIAAGEVDAPDVLVGGTPCQAFSIAGLRGGLGDERGALTLKYVELINEIDRKRVESGQQPAIAVWENVPGVLSSEDNAFGCFLAGLAGEDEEFQPGDRPEQGKNNTFWRWNAKTRRHVAKWPQSGCIFGPQRTIVWLIKDAQYFGVAQRRRRVFVVASARKDIDTAQILFEFDGVRRDIAPSRGKREEITGTAGNSIKSGSHWDDPANPHPTLNQSHNIGGIGQSNQEIFCQRGSGIIGTYRMMAFGEYADDETASTVKARDYKDATDLAVMAENEAPVIMAFPKNMSGTQCAATDSVCSSLMASNPTAVVISSHTYSLTTEQTPKSSKELAQTLTAGSPTGGGHPQCVAYSLQHAQIGRKDSAGPQAKGWQEEVNFTLDSRGTPDAVAYAFKEGLGALPGFGFAQNTRNEVRLQGGDGQICGSLSAEPGMKQTTYWVQPNMSVRRLTPVECERLQGFPDNWTLIPTTKRKKVTEDELAYLREYFPDLSEDEARKLAADGPRYKAIGNSMAVPVMRWIGERIAAAVDAAKPKTPGAIAHLRQPIAPAEFKRSIFKWAGGKYSVLPFLNEHLPHGKRLIEPFVGGGSVFTNGGYRENLLNDICDDLIAFYRVLQREGHRLITLAHRYFHDYNDAANFLSIRAAFNAGDFDDIHRAAAFLFLNRHCFNGLTRYNLRGEFNVGYGKYKAPYFPHEEMETFLGLSDKCEFVCGDFGGVIAAAGEGDVVFCDPPYEPLPDTDGFTSYQGHSFPFDEQKRLVSLLVDAHGRGAKVVITNSGAPNIRELYQANGFTLHQLQARRSVSCKGETRMIANDVIATLGAGA